VIYWLLKYVFIGPLLRVFTRPKVEGLENLPKSGGVLLASNHLAVIDSFSLPLMIPRRMTFPAKREYFTGPGVKGKLKKWFFAGAGAVPIDRSSGSAATAALETCTRLLKEGWVVGIYPEGTRSPDGRLFKGKTGVARIALQAKVPVVPVAMIGTNRVNPIGSKMWYPHKVTIRIGKPLYFDRYEGLDGDRFVERSITDEIMYDLMDLSGQEYVDVYAAKVKELEEAGRPDLDRLPRSKAS
jgi:1-acyl-sn-glycerol-3-phosphate acyltransferase